VRRKGDSDEAYAWVSTRRNILSVSGSIGQVHVQAALRFVLSLNAQKGTVIVNSPGGDEIDGLALYDLLYPYRKQLTSVGIGQVQSAAVLPYLACDRRLTSDGCCFMFHHGTFELPDPEPQREIPRIAAELMRTDRAYLNVIAFRTMMSLREVRKRCRNGYYFDSATAVANGFAHTYFNGFEKE
jgi:ATP-dependent protease ClpP protease subunit